MPDRPTPPQLKTDEVPGLRELLNSVQEHLQTATTGYRELCKKVDHLDEKYEERIGAIEQRIDGSKPPPPGAPPLVTILGAVTKKTDEAHKTASQVDLDAEAMDARLIRIERELAKQSHVMGIGKKGLSWLLSARGAKAAVSLATLAGALYAAFQAQAHAHAADVPAVVLPAPQGSR